MKKSVTQIVFTLGLLLGLLLHSHLSAQSIGIQGCVAGGFGIDTGVYSDQLTHGAGNEGVNASGVNDWFKGSGTGIGIINDTNSGVIQSLLQDGNNSFIRRMAHPRNSVNNGRLLLDGFFARDKFGGSGNTDPTTFDGGNKNVQSPANWGTKAGNVQNKNDIIDVAGHFWRDGEDESGALFFAGLTSINNPGGQAYRDFEFFVNKLEKTSNGFENTGNEGGRTAFLFDDGEITRIGALIIVLSVNNAGVLDFELRIWVARSVFNNPPSGLPFQFGGKFDGASQNSTYGFAQILPLADSSVQSCGYYNLAEESSLAPPWGTRSSSYLTDYPALSVFEVGLNLTEFGIDPAIITGADAAELPYKSLIVKSRSSDSFTSDLKDFGGVFNFGPPEIELAVDACYRMLSSPVETDYSELLSGVYTQGSDADGKEYHQSSGKPNVWVWNDDSWVDNADGDGSRLWGALHDLNTNIPAGSGLLLSMYEFNDIDDFNSRGPHTLTVHGVEHVAPVSPAMNSNPNGWTLVGNPFSTTVDFNLLGKNDLTGVAYIWDRNLNFGLGDWRSTDGNIGELYDGLIAPFQGFFVQNVGNNPEIVFNENSKTTDGTFYGKEAQQSVLRLEMSGESSSTSAWLTFSSRGNFENVYGDALQLDPMASDYTMLASRKTDGTLFDIGHYPMPGENFEVPIAMETTIPGTYTITATDLDLMLSHDLYFTDRKTNTTLAIDESFSYEFTISNGAAKIVSPDTDRCSMGVTQMSKSAGDDRFVITTKASAGVENDLPQDVNLKQNYPNPFNPNTSIQYTLPESANVTLEVYNMLGQRVAVLAEGQRTAGLHTVDFDATHLTSGVYMYRLMAGSTVLNKRMTLVK